MARKSKGAGMAWAVGLGTVALAAVGIVLYERSAGATAQPSGTTPAPSGGGTAATAPLTGQAAVSAVLSAGQGAGQSQAQIATYKALSLISVGASSHGNWIGSPEEVPARSWASQARAAGVTATQDAALKFYGL